ncbi:YopX family protein [Enterococcus hermanniensis]
MIPKFRGKCPDGGWIQGSCVKFDENTCFIMPEFCGASTRSYAQIFNHTAQYVDIETIGQSTGLKDKNGVEIFEGDVVVGQQHLTTDSSTPFEIKGLVRYSKRNTMFYLDEKSFGHQKFMSSLGSSIYQYEALGNIYENSELLEEIK